MKKYEFPIPAQILFAAYLSIALVHFSSYLIADPFFGFFSEFPFYIVSFFGLVPFWIYLIFQGNKFQKFGNQRTLIQIVKKFAPPWMIKLSLATIIYAFISFFINMIIMQKVGKAEGSSQFLRMASGHFLAFYTIGFTGITAFRNYSPRKCSNNHDVDLEAKHCSECGVELSNV